MKAVKTSQTGVVSSLRPGLRGFERRGSMRHMLKCLLCAILSLAMLTGCVGSSPPVIESPTATPRPPTVALPALVAEPQQWSGQEMTLIAPVLLKDDERFLTPVLPYDAHERAASQQVDRHIWLAEPLPENIRRQLDDGMGLLRLKGRLSPPGAYGTEQRFPYQFSASEIEVVEPERSTIANLVLNPHALNGMALQLDGILIARSDSALLADTVSEGGVPTAAGSELKLDPAVLPPELLQQLEESGDVRWGPVRVMGWWQDRIFTPLQIRVGDQS